MQQPSENWKRTRRAALERAHRDACESFTSIYTIYMGVCAVYLAGFVHFNFLTHGAELNLFTASLLIIAAIAGIFVPFLTGSVFALYFASQKLERLAAE